MNAVMREPYEAPVIPTETIEANLTFLRTSVDEVKAEMRGLQADNRSLRDKIDTVRSELIHPIEQVRTKLVDKIEQVSALLDKKIDQLAARLEGVSADQKAGDENIGAKIDRLTEKLSETNVSIAKVAAMQRVMLWVIGGIVSLAGLLEMIRAGQKFHWF